MQDAMRQLSAYETESTLSSRAQFYNSNSSLVTDNNICDCRQYKTSTVWHAAYGMQRFSLATRKTTQHYPRCRYSRTAVQKQDTEHVATARIQLFGTVANTILQMCFSATRGAGDVSISPWIAFHAVVDEKISPAFRLASLFDHIKRHNYKDREDMTARKMVFEAVLMQFRKLYMTGWVSPSDVNTRGENVMHLLATAVANVSIETSALLYYTACFLPITANRYRSVPVPYP